MVEQADLPVAHARLPTMQGRVWAKSPPRVGLDLLAAMHAGYL
jgi:hypothetical protein